MSDAKHTPEPWNCECGSLSIGDTGDYDDYVFVLAPTDGRDKGYGGNPKDIVAEVRIKRDDFETAKANGERIAACVTACAGMADPAADIAELRAENDRLRRYVGDEMIRSDFKTAAQMRSQLEHYRSEVTALRRNEAEAIDAIKAVGYVTPHGESDSLGEAVAWLVKAVEAGDRMADNLTALASDIERGDALAVRAFVRDYRKERAS